MVDKNKDEAVDAAPEKVVAVTLEGTVEKVIPPLGSGEPEKVQIAVKGADTLYREIRIENKLHDEAGKPVKLEKGAEVELTVEADHDSAIPHKPIPHKP